jgi:3-oxoacyl-[acyl-carrier protein] reductase
MDLGLDGLRALVGGASSGLGRAIATQLADEGARVALTARPGARLDEAAAATHGLAVAADLSTPDGPAAAVDTAVAELGGLDLLVVNSGGPAGGSFADLDEATWAASIDGVLHSALRLIRAGLPHLRESPSPAILIVLSSSVREPIPSLTTSNVPAARPRRPREDALGRDRPDPDQRDRARPRLDRPHRSCSTACAPSATGRPVEDVRREMIARIPLGRYGDPAEVGRLGAFLLSPAASYVSGAIVPIDGGMIRALP